MNLCPTAGEKRERSASRPVPWSYRQSLQAATLFPLRCVAARWAPCLIRHQIWPGRLVGAGILDADLSATYLAPSFRLHAILRALLSAAHIDSVARTNGARSKFSARAILTALIGTPVSFLRLVAGDQNSKTLVPCDGRMPCVSLTSFLLTRLVGVGLESTDHFLVAVAHRPNVVGRLLAQYPSWSGFRSQMPLGSFLTSRFSSPPPLAPQIRDLVCSLVS